MTRYIEPSYGWLDLYLLETTEAVGMGKAHHQQKNTTQDFILGQYVTGNNGGGGRGGIRTYLYSTDATVNPLRSPTIATLSERLVKSGLTNPYNVYAALVDDYGWSATARTGPK
ncbi:hypothetical protein BC835DRAFT_1414088 [Cytidiella melzeri]|nr:hypothetical protein BC835DRAFT_1414088 [Cytidiella melzeri]